MLPKLAALAQSKTAIAVLGVVLIGGGSGAVAVAATTGHLSTLGVNLNSIGQSKTPDATEAAGGSSSDAAHTVGVEGLMTACSTTANTLSVTDKAGKSWTFNVASTTKFNGATKSNEGGASTGGASTGGASTTPLTLADVCITANVNAMYVEVAATPNSTGYDARKVTLQGFSRSSGSEGSGTSTEGKDTSTPEPTQAPEPREMSGTATNVTASGFTMTHDGASIQVVVTATTTLSGAASLSAIPNGAHVSVQGTLSGSTFTATAVQVSAPDSSSTSSPSATGTSSSGN